MFQFMLSTWSFLFSSRPSNHIDKTPPHKICRTSWVIWGLIIFMVYQWVKISADYHTLKKEQDVCSKPAKEKVL